MFRLLSYLKQCKKSVLAIVLLLIVQAYCDLALPQYTSDIVDVGIQQGGITYAAPEWMREETWGSLQNLMTEGEKELTASCYEQAEDGTYERTTNKTADLEALNDAFRMPMVMLSAMDESAETALNDGADAAGAHPGAVSASPGAAKRLSLRGAAAFAAGDDHRPAGRYE